ncbi:hypothetical protein OIU77_028066 [Salix suchowensis]|uniref:Uncharacterized protein n=1 Tax=Salix suchowensis TaxID=1278906 RepID=A0ABQ9BG72_9ROSI|nr:hypothetical protein OIU77_028066 [Salix suchowensis]
MTGKFGRTWFGQAIPGDHSCIDGTFRRDSPVLYEIFNFRRDRMAKRFSPPEYFILKSKFYCFCTKMVMLEWLAQSSLPYLNLLFDNIMCL